MRGSILRRNYGSVKFPTEKEYRKKHLEAMAREEKKYNATYGTSNTKYQKLLARSKKKKSRNTDSDSIFMGL